MVTYALCSHSYICFMLTWLHMLATWLHLLPELHKPIQLKKRCYRISEYWKGGRAWQSTAHPRHCTSVSTSLGKSRLLLFFTSNLDGLSDDNFYIMQRIFVTNECKCTFGNTCASRQQSTVLCEIGRHSKVASRKPKRYNNTDSPFHYIIMQWHIVHRGNGLCTHRAGVQIQQNSLMREERQ